MRLVSVDIGNGFVKAKAGDNEACFPSVGALEQGVVSFDGLRSGHDLIIEIDGERWAFGETAYKVGRMHIVDMGRGRIEQGHYRRLYAAALASVIGRGDDLSVVASLPVRWYTGERDKVRRILATNLSIGYDGRDRNIRISYENVHIIPEGFGSLCSQVLSTEGKIINAELGRSVIGVVDIGTRTTDYLYFNSLELYPAKSDAQDSVGMSTVWSQIGEQISKKYQRDLSELEIDNAISSGQIRDGGDRISIKSEIHIAGELLAESISSKIRSLWDNGREVDKILVTGGGADLVFEFLPFKNKLVVDDAYFANTAGAYRFGLLRGIGNGA